MNSFNVKSIQTLIEQSLKEEPTGDNWLDSRYQEQIHWIGHTNPYYRLFYLLAKELQPTLTVELGSWQATGAAHFAAGNSEGIVVTVDIHREDKDAQKRAIEAADHYDNLTYLNMWTWDAIGFFEGLATPINILYIDAWHDYTLVKREWELYSKLLSDNALVICDDITTAYNFEGMLKFWEEMPEPKFLFSEGLHGNIPMGFAIYNYSAPQTKELVSNVEQDKSVSATKSGTVARRGRPPKKPRA